ncbi:MAG: hypothetical protein WCK90_04315 [archaeon]
MDLKYRIKRYNKPRKSLVGTLFNNRATRGALEYMFGTESAKKFAKEIEIRTEFIEGAESTYIEKTKLKLEEAALLFAGKLVPNIMFASGIMMYNLSGEIPYAIFAIGETMRPMGQLILNTTLNFERRHRESIIEDYAADEEASLGGMDPIKALDQDLDVSGAGMHDDLDGDGDWDEGDDDPEEGWKEK